MLEANYSYLHAEAGNNLQSTLDGELQIDYKIRKQKWIQRGHMLGRTSEVITAQILEWKRQSHRNTYSPCNTSKWIRRLIRIPVKMLIINSVKHRGFVDALCSK